jgi:hypothetical protein
VEDYSISSKTETTVGGRPALLSEGMPRGHGVRQVEIHAGKQTSVFLSASSANEAFDPALFDRIIGSIEIEHGSLGAADSSF